MKIPVSEFVDLLWEYLRPQIGWTLLLATTLLSGVGMSLWAPMILANFIDAAAEAQALETLTRLAVFFIFAQLVKLTLGAASSYLSTRIGWTATNALREDIVCNSMTLDMGFHNSHTPGEMIERVDEDVGILNNFFSIFVIQIGNSLLLLLGIHVVVFMENWRIGLAFLGFSILTLFIISSIRHRGVPLQIAARKTNAEMYGFLEENVGGIEDISSCGASAYTLKRFLDRARANFFSMLKANMFSQLMLDIGGTLFFTANALTLALGAYFYIKGEASIGLVYLLYHYSSLLRGPIEKLVVEMDNLNKAEAVIHRIREIRGVKSAVDDGKGRVMPGGPLGIEFDGVSFTYEKGAHVLEDITFKLGAKRSLGLVGHTGSGKTTLTRLLFRFYDPTSGIVKLNGQNIREPNIYDLRSRISLVTQNVQLFIGSIRDNLTFFDETVEEDRILDALQRLGLMDWLDRLPNGLDTRLSPENAGLSEGEAQLLAMARVLVADYGDIIVLDEPSSRLDPTTETWIQNAMQELAKTKTAIIIAHHLSTLSWVDDIMVLESGRIVEYGDRETLLKTSESRYAALLETGIEMEGK